MKTRDNRLAVFASVALSALFIMGAFLAMWLVPRNATPAAAQTDTVKPSQITVVGIGSVNATPDILKITIGVSAQETTVKAAQTKVESAISAIRDRLAQAGISDKDYKTAVYSVEPVMDFSNSKDGASGTLNGFRVVNMLEITFRAPADAPAVIDSLVDAGANQVYGTYFSFSDPNALSKQAYDAAIKDAQSRAEEIARLSNMTLGKVVSVSESATGPYPYYAKEGMGGGGGFVPGQQMVQTSLTVTYEATPSK
jgi:uncharacterized protein YggE